MFIERVLDPIRRATPGLRVVMEHITTAEAVAYLRAGDKKRPRRDDHRPAPHARPQRDLRRAVSGRTIICLPVLKRGTHREALVALATSGFDRVFLGTDSAAASDPCQGSRMLRGGVFHGPRGDGVSCGALRRSGRARPAGGVHVAQRAGVLPPAANEARDDVEEGRAGRMASPGRDRRGSGDGLVAGAGHSLAGGLEGEPRGREMIQGSYPEKSEIARLSAAMLLEVGAVHFNAREPFTLASGLPSPTYIDCRKLISYPRIRSTLMDFMSVTVMREAGFEAFTTIAGGETAGIPFAALVAERLALPMTYVRKKPKGYGRNARIEGVMGENDRVLLVEDLTTDGGSKLSFVDAIPRDGGDLRSYRGGSSTTGIFEGVEESLGAHGVRLHHLTTWWDVLAEARAREAFDGETLAEVESFLSDPRAWQAARG